MDPDLVRSAQTGDREAFARLAVDVCDRLFAVAQQILRDSDAAGDVLQTALVQIWRDLPALRDPDRFKAWCVPGSSSTAVAPIDAEPGGPSWRSSCNRPTPRSRTPRHPWCFATSWSGRSTD